MNAQNDEAAIAGAKAGYPAPAFAWSLVAALMISYAVSYLDRNILSLLVQPIKRDLHLTDTDVSLLQGLAFVVLFTVAGLVFGRLVDRFHRLRFAAAGIAFWSVMTAGCGLVRSYGAIFLCRIGVGAGEATLAPAAYSLVADCFPPERRGTALGTYSIGVYLGQGFAMVAGAYVLQVVAHMGPIVLPVFGRIYGWQAIFLAVSVLGLPLSLCLLLFKEPRRRGTVRARTGVAPADIPMRAVWRYIAANARTLTTINLCHALVAMAVFALTSWVPTFFIRTFHSNPVTIGKEYGLIVALCGAAGVLAGGMLGDLLRAKGRRNGHVMVQACAGVVTLPFAFAFPLAGSAATALWLLVPTTFFAAFTVATHTPAQLEMVPNQMRGFTSSLTLLVSNVIGLGLGPTAIALFTDYVLRDEQLIRYSLAVVPPLALALSSAIGWFGLKPYLASLDYEKAWSEAADLD